MVFRDYKKALAAARQSGGTLKANPEGEGWVLFNMKTPIHQKTPKPKQNKHSKVSLDYLSKKTKKPPSFSGTIPYRKPDPKNKIPKEQRRKVDDGIGGSREAWENKRKGYIGDGRTQ